MPVASLRRLLAAAALFSVGAASLLELAPAKAADAFTDEPVVNAAVNDELIPLGRGRTAERGSQSYLLYRTRFGWKPYVQVRDTASTASAHIALPESPGPTGSWDNAAYAVTPNGELWTLSGVGPVVVRRYQLGTTTATLVSATTFGTSDSRAGALTVLASGAVVGVWHQQGATGPNGLGIAYWSGSAWSTQTLDFMPTAASKQAIVQHPADGSVWLFSDPDAWHGIGAAHLTETPTGLRVDWTDPSWIDSEQGEVGPDPENPDIQAATDASTGTVVLAYQGNRRQTFLGSPAVTASYPVVARIPAAGAPSFVQLPVWVERISALGLVARPGEVWLAYRPVDTSNNTFSKVAVSRYDVAAAAWSASTTLGTAYDSYARTGFGLSRPEFSFRAADSQIHRFTFGAAPSSPTTTSTTTAPSTTTTTAKPAKRPRR